MNPAEEEAMILALARRAGLDKAIEHHREGLLAAAHRAFAARRLTPTEVVEALLARIAAQDGTLHAFIRLDAEGARAAAAEATPREVLPA